MKTTPMSADAANEATILEKALSFAAAEARQAYLQGACGGDEQLRARVQALLEAHEAAGGFLAEKTRAVAPTIRIEPLPDEGPGTVIGRYKLLQQIGEGGCGVVYMAEQEEPVRRRVALKVIKLGMDTKQVVARFEAERQALALMDHPNIAKVFDAGTTSTGRPFFVMELVRGIKITEYCDQNNLSTQARLNLLVQVCQAIQHAHQKGIIHRDIKPSNVLVSLHDGVPEPVVIDFGIAKATEQRLTEKTLFTQFEQFMGTPAYTSPEQAEMSRLDIDTRSDIYSLGVLLYELLTGKTPFDGKELIAAGLEEMRRTIREQEPARPSTRLSTMLAGELTATAQRRQADPPKLIHLVRGDLDWIVMKALEKDRTRRYETASGLAQDIERHLNNELVVARPPSAAYKFQKFARRNKTAFAAGTVVVIALLIGVTVSTWQAVRASREARRARQAEALAQRRLTESEAISKFMTDVFQSPDPERDGRFITVAETLAAAAKKLETDLAIHPSTRAQLQATLGSTYSALGLCRNAVPLQEKVYNYHRANSGPKHPDTIRAMIGLVIPYADAGRTAEALKLGEEGLTLSREVHGLEPPDTLTAMQGLVASYLQAGRPADAVKLGEEAFALSGKALGSEHPDTIRAMGTLAGAYRAAGHQSEAIKLGEEVLTLRRKVHGPENPRTLRSMGNLASFYTHAGRGPEALGLLEKELALSRRILGPDHPDTLGAMSQLSFAYADARRPADALALAEEALALSRKVNGAEHPQTLGAMHALAVSYTAAGRRAEAIKLAEELLALSRKVLGPEHPEALGAMHNLANSYAVGGRLDDALKLREEVLTIRRKVDGPEHSYTIGAMGDLAASYLAVGRVTEGLPLLEEASARSPANTIAALKLAALQVWFGKEAEHAANCERVLNWAAGTNLAEAADRAARLTCLRPNPDAPQLERALTLARRAVQIGQPNEWLPWYQLSLGMAEYRTGLYPAADRTLLAVRQTDFNNPHLYGTAGFYRVMSLFRQGKPAEARQLFVQTEARMNPLPADEKNPLAGGAGHDDLIVWLAYKEAKALLDSSALGQSRQSD